MDQELPHRGGLLKQGFQESLNLRDELSSAAEAKDDGRRIVSGRPVKEPSTVRLMVVLGGLWVGEGPALWKSDMAEQKIAWSPSRGIGYVQICVYLLQVYMASS